MYILRVLQENVRILRVKQWTYWEYYKNQWTYWEYYKNQCTYREVEYSNSSCLAPRGSWWLCTSIFVFCCHLSIISQQMDALFSKPCHITKLFSHSIVQLVEYPLMAIQFGVPLQMKVRPFDCLLVTQHHLSNKSELPPFQKGNNYGIPKWTKLFHRNKQCSIFKMHKDTVLWPIEINDLCWKCTDTVL